MRNLVGLDLSTSAAAAVAVPTDWDGNWQRVQSVVVGNPKPARMKPEQLREWDTEDARIQRAERIAQLLGNFCRGVGASEAWIESYAFNLHTSAHTLGELGGIVRLELMRAGIALQVAQMSTARKLLLGHVPRGKAQVPGSKQTTSAAKIAARSALVHAGAPPDWTLDQVDAMVAVNLGLSNHVGAYCFCQEAA